MNFENIAISSPDNDRFLNFVPSVINLYFQIGKSENRLEVSFNFLFVHSFHFLFISYTHTYTNT